MGFITDGVRSCPVYLLTRFVLDSSIVRTTEKDDGCRYVLVVNYFPSLQSYNSCVDSGFLVRSYLCCGSRT